MLKSLCFLSLASLGYAAAAYLVTTDYLDALAGSDAQVIDYMIVYDDNDNALCDTLSDTGNMHCQAPEDGTTCGGTYTGSNNAWNGQSLSGTFSEHDSGFNVNAGQLSFPDQQVDPSTDTRCEPYKCTDATGGGNIAVGGFR